MKKLLVVLLSLGLIVAFSMTASAADVKFSGSYYLQGVYDNNPNLLPSETATSRAYFFQRVRITPVFAIAEGLSFTTQFDALEKQWGNTNWRRGVGVGDDGTSTRPGSLVPAANPNVNVGSQETRLQENIEFERAFVTFLTGIGQFQVGYQESYSWGTQYGDSTSTAPRILYATKFGPLTLSLIYEKMFDTDNTANALNYGKTDADNTNYALAAIYNGKGIEAGFLYRYYAYKAGMTLLNANGGALGSTGRNGNGATKYHLLSPYAKMTFGPVFIETELSYVTGKFRESEVAGVADMDLKGYSFYLHAKANIGPAYFGGMYAYTTGEDLADPTKNGTNPGGGGTSWNPALILMAYDFSAETRAARNTAGNTSSGKINTIFYKAYGGFNPSAKLNIEAGLTYATVQTLLTSEPTRSKDLGIEFDVTATYKIYDNLSYMVGMGYLWTGDWFKGVPGPAQPTVGNDYMLTNKLSLSF